MSRAAWHLRANALVVAWLALAGAVALAHRWVPASGWLLVHLAMLGAASTAILVWSAHFAEALRRRPLPGGHRGQAARLAVHTAGAAAVVAGVVAEVWPLVVAGAVGVAAGALWHAAVLVAQGRGALAVRLAGTVHHFVAAALCLPLGATAGALLARTDAAGEPAARTYVAHVALMLLGWVGLTVVGALHTLWPTMLRVPVEPREAVAAEHGLVVLLTGLGGVVAGAAAGVRLLVVVGLVAYLAGLVRSALPLVAQARRRAPDTVAARSVAAAGAWLVAGVAAWAVAAATSPWVQVQAVVGLLVPGLAAGFGAQVLLGALSHLGPMVLGGGAPAVRAAKDVVERAGSARLVLLNGALVLFVVPTPSLVRVAASLVGLVALGWTLALLLRAVVVSRRVARETVPGAPTTVPVASLAARRSSTHGPAVAGLAALVLVVAAAVGADPAAVGLGRAADAGAEPTGRTVEVQVEARDMRFVPDSVEVDAGDAVVLVVTNADDQVHDLVLDTAATTGRLAPGETARLELGVVGRATEGWCSVAGHRQMGMVFEVTVVGGPVDGTSDAEADGGAGDGHGAMVGMDEATTGGATSSAAADMDLAGEPTENAVLRDATLPPATDETVHRVTLRVEEVEREVAPGVRQTLWTFGGEAPGPVLRGRVGDTFEITLVNDGSLGHSIDFHAGALAPDGPMRTIQPGETLTYTFTATRSGVWMYHCSTMPMSLHIANGMAGAVVIDPPDLAPVDREYLVAQHELYLGEQGGIADPAKIAAERPDAVVFNGYANQYDHEPLAARVGERVRIWVLDLGPSRASAFHVVGGQFDTVYREGAYVLGGPGAAPTTGGAQVLALLPAEGGFVELAFPEPGHYPFVTHAMVDAERGAHGTVAVTP